MNYLGIDISKSTARCVIINNDGEKSVKPFTLKNNKYEFKRIQRYKKQYIDLYQIKSWCNLHRIKSTTRSIELQTDQLPGDL